VITPPRAALDLESFNYAFEGIIHVLRTQRNMRIHFASPCVVLVAALASDVSRLELIALLLAIAFVLIAEMINTAIEAASTSRRRRSTRWRSSRRTSRAAPC
jgi:diacylglycerol kinase (ATP)